MPIQISSFTFSDHQCFRGDRSSRSSAASGREHWPNGATTGHHAVVLAPLTIVMGKTGSGKSTLLGVAHFSALAPHYLRNDFGDECVPSSVSMVSGKLHPLDGGGQFTVNRGTPGAVLHSPIETGMTQTIPVGGLVEGTSVNLTDEIADAARSLYETSAMLGVNRAEFSRVYARFVGISHHLPPRDHVVIAHLLREHDTLLAAVSAWLEANLGMRLEVRTEREERLFGLWLVGRGGQEVNLAFASDGVRHLLPVVVLCCQRRLQGAEGTFLDTVEYPEMFLHPAHHGALGELLVGAVASRMGTIVVETHSEVLLLRVRALIAERVITPDMVSVLYVEAAEDGSGSHIRPITITDTGDVEDWPEGIFSEAFSEVKRLRRAQRSQG